MSAPPANTGKISTTEGFILGGIAACIAVTISNPAEVVKTRLQLQGELAKAGAPKVYNNAIDALAKTWRNEGIRGVQRGLGPALIGRPAEEQIPFTSVLAGATSGAVGASLGNPMFLIKARMQAYSPALPVGTQHHYKSSLDALATIFRAEGFRGLVRGIDAAILRTSMGSSVQLPSYNFTKTQLVKHGILPEGSTWTFLASSTVSGACVCLAMQPADTALTRVYNQPTTRNANGKIVGTLYRNPIDCLWKTFKAEGVRGWYKGSTAHFLRIAPHTIVTLTANDIIINLYKKIRDRQRHDV
ncbi:Mitochondrial oxaloacetate carrier protein [Paramarasmius palmivorus]|uniref:Mitochondrial oxaloacetate carrier protein n=1 Tax=Paramarasmius palmivorus TaxID=297713 RepID=A0AAW0E551_9AGAR